MFVRFVRVLVTRACVPRGAVVPFLVALYVDTRVAHVHVYLSAAC